MTNAPWRVELERRARKDLDRLDPPVQRRVLKELSSLCSGPSAGIRALKGRPGYRLRVGDWRVILEIDRTKRVITVDRVLPRGRAYDR